MKNLKQKSLLPVLMATFILNACTKEKEVIREVPAPAVDSKVTGTSDAESLAMAGEQLIAPTTFFLAHQVLELALSKDPNNKRAQLYHHFLAPMMEFKGVLTRIKPFTRSYGDIGKLDSFINNSPNSPLKKWLTEGKEDLSTTKDIQDLIIRYREKMDGFRKFLKSNPELDITLYMNPDVFSNYLKENAFSNHCAFVKKHDDWQNPYEDNWSIECNWVGLVSRQLTPADTLALSQVVAGNVLFLGIYSNYGMDGAEKLIKLQQNGNELQPSFVQTVLESEKSFGQLRADHNFGILKTLGSDASAAFKYMAQYQSTLCPKMPESPWWMKSGARRPGYVFEQGLCVNTSEEAFRNLAILDQALTGVTKAMVKDAQDRPYELTFNAFIWAEKPVADLRTIAPKSYNSCGQVVAYRDSTMGGILPNADMPAFIKNDCWR